MCEPASVYYYRNQRAIALARTYVRGLTTYAACYCTVGRRDRRLCPRASVSSAAAAAARARTHAPTRRPAAGAAAARTHRSNMAADRPKRRRFPSPGPVPVQLPSNRTLRDAVTAVAAAALRRGRLAADTATSCHPCRRQPARRARNREDAEATSRLVTAVVTVALSRCRRTPPQPSSRRHRP